MDVQAAPTATGPRPEDESSPSGERRVALLGNPNTGKTTLFNQLSGLRQKTANFPGTTQEARVGHAAREGGRGTVEIIDLPGTYSLDLEQPESIVCRRVLAGETAPRGEAVAAPDALCVVVDASNLDRSLVLLGEALRRRLPTVVAVSMGDVAARLGVKVSASALEQALGCPVVAVNPRKGTGVSALLAALDHARPSTSSPGPSTEEVDAWADALDERVATSTGERGGLTLTDRLDRAFTHPILGLAAFVAIMTGLFWVLFRFATIPMDLIDGAFGSLVSVVESVLPAGFISDLLANGVIAGVGATVIFLPQICLLFFLLSILEDTGYLARAAFVLDRLLRPFGLSGHAFVPLLSSHACALPGIMATRAIPDRRERLAAILVAPFMTCSARLPVYALLAVVLFPDRPALQALAFIGGYVVGALAGLLSALVARRSLLRGPVRPMVLELPSYKRPSLRTALLTTWDRASLFLRKAGTVILAITIVLWWTGTYPIAEPPASAVELRAEAAQVADADPAQAEILAAEADRLEARHLQSRSLLGRTGALIEPVVAPLGYDRQLAIGVLASFAAREVFVSTMAVQVTGQDDAEDESVLEQLRGAERDDGTALFTTATAWSLLVFYVLAMQCLPTLAVTAREAGGARWAFLQLGWMTAIAFVAALATYQVLGLAGIS